MSLSYIFVDFKNYPSDACADPKDPKLRTQENSFMLGPLLIYARFSLPLLCYLLYLFKLFTYLSHKGVV